MPRIDGNQAAEMRVARGLFRGLSDRLKRRAGVLFHPVGNLRPESAAGYWRSEGFDSYFYVPMRCQAGPLLVSFDATLCDAGADHLDRWRLYFDIGEGFREDDCLTVGCSGARIEIETTIDLPAPVRAFRIDPCERSGRFVLHELALTPLGVSQPPSDDVPRGSAPHRRWSALLRKMMGAVWLMRLGCRRESARAKRGPVRVTAGLVNSPAFGRAGSKGFAPGHAGSKGGLS